MSNAQPNPPLGATPPADVESSMIARAAESRLRQTSHHALRRVTCEVNNGVAVLRGAVPSFYLKQVAQIVIGNLDGVARIVNQIDVSPNMEIEDERWR